MSAPTGQELERTLAEARGGDSPALGQLLQRYRAYLNLLARLRIGPGLAAAVDPSDLIQETFLQAGHDFPQFRGTTERELLAWLRTILTHRIADAARRHGGGPGAAPRPVSLAALDRSADAPDGALLAPDSTPSQHSVRREQAVLLADALARLPEHYREVLILHHVEGLGFPDLARRTGRTLDGVKNVWIRAVAALRRSFGREP